jgi:type 1 glutamine amidotransferase
MKRTIKRILLWGLLALFLAFAVSVALNWDKIQRSLLGGLHVYETKPPILPAELKRPAILVFSKTNGFRHEEAIPAANALFSQIARDNDWGYFQTENGASFDPAILSRFDAVVFNNVSGDVFAPNQRQALKDFIENGGGFVGVHGAGGDFSYEWRWYVDQLIGAQFKGHPLGPQFQRATVRVEDRSHPATQALPETWQRVDEWYSFDRSPRRPGYHVLLTLDEKSYANHKMMGKDLSMGADHPLAWWHCTGKGRVFYSAMGHKAAAYREPEYRTMLLGALNWALHGKECATPTAAATESAR